jgi:hypothetical protein
MGDLRPWLLPTEPEGDTTMTRSNRWLVALPLVGALALSACTAKPPTSAKIDHAQVDKNLRKVVLTSEAARHLDIKTAAVREEQIARTRIMGGEIVILPAATVTGTAPAPTPAPVSDPMSAADQFPALLEERFELNTSGWPNDPTSTAWLDPDGLGYRLASAEPGRFVAVGAPGIAAQTDVYVSATVRKTAGPSGGGYGLIVRDQQPNRRDGRDQGGSYYVFEVSDRGEYGVWQRDGSRWIDLVRWTPSNAVKPGGAENQLSVAAVGESMTFVINGTPVTTVTDSTLKSGGVGIFAGGDGDSFLLDQFIARAPKPAPVAAAPVADATRTVVRVPLSRSDQNQIVRGQGSKVLPLIPDTMASSTPAQPAEVTGDSGALFYVVDNATPVTAGQRVRVEVPIVGGGPQRKVLPYSSVIYDLKGEAWAYTSPAPLTFVRDRIAIDFIDGDNAVLSQGPAIGTAVVTTGAAELFGTEQGVGH